ncbi:MAG: beta-ketoacyl-ACP synthase [Lysobacterales bacterium]|jgi:3-oxoacyl-[acyl-carrier-protein] synthase II
MSTEKTEVWITGIGLVSSLGEGLDTHWEQLTTGQVPVPSVDTGNQAPYLVHPIVDIEVGTQIPKKSDQRQMGPWQHLGVYTAGLALDDAGIAHEPGLLAATNMIVAAGGGERDLDVDTVIMEQIDGVENPGPILNASLNSELRPTLFLAQLSNLMAGNISIVHGVTDSSRTFMGEESAGVSAVETAVAQIQHGQGDVFLVGGAYIAERADMSMLMEFGHTLWQGEHGSVWSREDTAGGMNMGSAGAFLILESRKHAEARGAKPYARINKVVSDRCNRQPGAARQVADRLFEQISDQVPKGPLPVLSGCCGVQPQLKEERDFLTGLSEHGIDPAVRGVTTVLGNTLEAQLPLNVILASLAISKGAFFDPFDDSGVEKTFSGAPQSVLISTWGHWRGESLALVERPDAPLRGDK